MHAVELDEVSRCYGDHTAVSGLSLRVPRGALLGLLGANGAGKTTCLNMITALLPPSAGRVRVCGHDVCDDRDKAKKVVGYAPEEPRLYAGLTPAEHVELSARLHGLSAKAARRASERELGQLGLDDRAFDPIATLSKGMRRKTLLAAAFAHDPKVVVLDEPLEGLDVFAQAALKERVRACAASGKTVIYSTHTLEVVASLCTHVALLAAGRLLATGPLDEVLRRLRASSLLEAFAAADAGSRT